MYEQFYQLREPPFELTADTRYLFLTAGQREALSNIEYGLSNAKSLTVLTGEAGTGKTTLLLAALESPRCRRVRCVYLNNPTLSRTEFFELLARRFQLPVGASHSKATLIDLLEQTLTERRTHGEIVSLVVDEAQRLPLELLEEVRLLGNMEVSAQKLLPLVLSGQPELAARLEEPALRQLKQRVSLRCELRPFELSETAVYVAARITTAGGVPANVFTQEAIALIHRRSEGIPRTISVICDNAMISGMALGRQPVDRSVVLEVCRDFAFGADDRSEPGEAAPTFDRVLLHPEPVATPFRSDMDEPRVERGLFSSFGSRQKPRRFSLFAREGNRG